MESSLSLPDVKMYLCLLSSPKGIPDDGISEKEFNSPSKIKGEVKDALARVKSPFGDMVMQMAEVGILPIFEVKRT